MFRGLGLKGLGLFRGYYSGIARADDEGASQGEGRL